MKTLPPKRDFVKRLLKGQPFNKGSPSYPPKTVTPPTSFPQKTQYSQKIQLPHKIDLTSTLLPQVGVLSVKALVALLRSVQIGESSPLPNGRLTRRRRRKRRTVRCV